MTTITKTSPALARRPDTGLVKVSHKERSALTVAHRELAAVDLRLAKLARLKDLRRELDAVPQLFAAGKVDVGDAIRSAPAGLSTDALNSIRGVLSTACKSRIRELLAGVAEIVVGIEAQSLANLESKAAAIRATEEKTAAELGAEFEPSAALAGLLESCRREAAQVDFMRNHGVNRQALARAMAAAGIDSQTAALPEDGETTDHAEMLADMK